MYLLNISLLKNSFRYLTLEYYNCISWQSRIVVYNGEICPRVNNAENVWKKRKRDVLYNAWKEDNAENEHESIKFDGPLLILAYDDVWCANKSMINNIELLFSTLKIIKGTKVSQVEWWSIVSPRAQLMNRYYHHSGILNQNKGCW